MTNRFNTWSHALNWYWDKKAKRQAQAKTFHTNAARITSYGGASLPLTRMSKGSWWVEFQEELQAENPEMSTSTVNRITSAGTVVLRKTREAGLHLIDCPKVERLPEGKSRLIWFTKDQVDNLVHIAKDIFDHKDLADAILFSAYTGLRQGELLKIKPCDVSTDLTSLTIGGRSKFVTKTKDVRTIPIHEKIRPLIASRLDNEYLFKGDWANKDQLYRVFKKVRKEAGISEDHVWHCLRHSFGTWLGEVTHPRQIMALMGHSSIDTSLRYTHATDKAIRSAILAI
tara:strand:+ start:5195 stop:6049 length:855 start_codon:yes stop_codon:yes gene_type:complete